MPVHVNEIGVSVYDVEDKKLVMVFKASVKCALYCFGRETNLRQFILARSRSTDNLFNRVITFRAASKEQLSLIPNKDRSVILDPRYKKQIVKTVPNRVSKDKSFKSSINQIK